MKNKIIISEFNERVIYQHKVSEMKSTIHSKIAQKNTIQKHETIVSNDLAEILIIASYPPRECGIATYSQDLIKALNNKFSNSLSIKVCALEAHAANYIYPREVKYILNTSVAADYKKLADTINKDERIAIVLVQHEFGLFKAQEQAFLLFLGEITKPVIVAFHTVLPNPDERLKSIVKSIAATSESIIVMTNNSAHILTNDYKLPKQKIAVIPHGTHLVPHLSEQLLKIKYGLKNRKVLTTFGLLSSGKGIETTLEALPAIIEQCPDLTFLIIGKTHPEVVKEEGEKYRESLKKKVELYGLQNNVKFINYYLTLPDLLEYLQLTDIYIFTTNDPNQAVSGTFSYAMSCACPIISTPIPHAKEVLTEDTGIIFDFRNSQQLGNAVIRLLNDEPFRKNISVNTLQKIVFTAWENSSVAHAMLFEKIAGYKIKIQYNLPEINLDHLKRMTTNIGIIQFSKINQPDIESGYTLDDNARALVVSCMYYKLTGDQERIPEIYKYLRFIKYCMQPGGDFVNYVDKNNKFTFQNKLDNLDDANGRAVWALGYLVSLTNYLPKEIISEAETMLQKTLLRIDTVHSTRAMAFAIKGIYFNNQNYKLHHDIELVKKLANRLVQMYKHESNANWQWFEGYLTYANSILPEAMLYAWSLTGDTIYKEIAISAMNFLMEQIFNEQGIEVISNKNWYQKGQAAGSFGEQPIDVAYTIMTLSKFYDVLGNPDYQLKMFTAFNWFLGKNRLHQIIYNPCTGGCYDGLEETHVNLNQGAESTLSYLMARLTIESYKNE